MPLRRLLLFIFILFLLGLFLWAAVNVNRKVEISSFTTSIDDLTSVQVDNLQLAIARIDDFVLKPGDVFSFNETVGERLRTWGYKGAPTIYQGRMIDTPGGGLCQLSSTIYNAALMAGLEVIERTPHLWTIGSIGPGLDAAILYSNNANIDLQFRNPYEFPVKLKVEIQGSRLIARILAPEKPQEDVSVDVQVLQVFPAPRYPYYPEGSPEHSPVPSKGRDGYKVRVYRYFKKDGKTIKKEVISIDKYEPVPGRINN